MRITIVGCGSIGSKLAKAADAMSGVKRIYLLDVKREVAERTAAELNKAIVIESVEEELYHSDLVIEAASQEAAREILPKVVSRGVDIMIMSVGSLVDDDFRGMVFDKARAAEARVYIPTGALCGCDGLRSASVDELDEVELISMKGPKSLLGVEYMERQGIDVERITEKTTVYTGYAREAVKLFPKNINVAATVSLLGVGFDRTKVTVVVDPEIKSNSHELRIKGRFGEMNCHTYNIPEPDNPRTSHLATLSAIAALKRIVRNEWFGV
ncbi:MAG: aspartate dehydrogenase [Methanomassiliicoccaceae archaeon]|nr:aspartate dehydrogenase [Methanomassiliicoccaceae archaeon]